MMDTAAASAGMEMIPPLYPLTVIPTQDVFNFNIIPTVICDDVTESESGDYLGVVRWFQKPRLEIFLSNIPSSLNTELVRQYGIFGLKKQY